MFVAGVYGQDCCAFYMPSKVWDEVTYPFPNLNGSTIEV